MEFKRLPKFESPSATSPEGAYLEANGWDDFGYQTLWTLYYVAGRKVLQIGSVKIADFKDSAAPQIPETFSALPSTFFSLGQDEDYYLAIGNLGSDVREELLTALRDIAFDQELFRRVEDLPVTDRSLFRQLNPDAVPTTFHRLAKGGAKLSPFSFTYQTAAISEVQGLTNADPSPGVRLSFEVIPNARPRTNLHVIIGRNGVGKSFVVNDMAKALVSSGSSGVLTFGESGDSLLAQKFTNVVSVAFSAFDSFAPPVVGPAEDGIANYHYIGLKQTPQDDDGMRLKGNDDLCAEFTESLGRCHEMRRFSRWKWVLDFLASDPMFSSNLDRLIGIQSAEVEAQAGAVFNSLSSGHKIVLLTMTRLVETVEEATLVLIDEPEVHLHPPLLSAFITALAELLENRNGVAVVVTHSPVVLQEVPRECVWNIDRLGDRLVGERPSIETYGENVGVLTQEVFGLEVPASGFHRALADAVAEGGTYEELVQKFNGSLGDEARALLRVMSFHSKA